MSVMEEARLPEGGQGPEPDPRKASLPQRGVRDTLRTGAPLRKTFRNAKNRPSRSPTKSAVGPRKSAGCPQTANACQRGQTANVQVTGTITHDAAVLDLYAGSGALAIEALSRGAARAVLVDRDAAAEAAVLANLSTTGFDAVATFVRSTVERFLRADPPARPFDLVFLDPPYDSLSTEVAAVLEQLHGARWLTSGATVVVERPKGATPVELPEGWGIEKERAYGDTLLMVAIA